MLALRWLVMPWPSRGDVGRIEVRIEVTYQLALQANKRSVKLRCPRWVAIKALEMNHSIDSSRHTRKLRAGIHQGSILGS